MKRFNKLLAVLCVTFDREFSPLICEAYGEALKNFKEDDLLRVGGKMLRGHYFPRPYDFIKAIEGKKPENKDIASLRWSEVVGWINNSRAFPDDPIAKRIIEDMGDWFMFRQCTDKELNGHGFTFRAAYVATILIEDSCDAQIESQEMIAMTKAIGDGMKMVGTDD